MRKTLLHIAALILLAGMLGGHISELMDHWDHTLRTGKDVDYTVVVIAASIGIVFGVAGNIVSAVSRLLARVKLRVLATYLFSAVRTMPLDRLATGPPLLSLFSFRI